MNTNNVLQDVDWEKVVEQVEMEEGNIIEYDVEVEMLTKDLKEMKMYMDGVPFLGDFYGDW